jgi:hypothetical protein
MRTFTACNKRKKREKKEMGKLALHTKIWQRFAFDLNDIEMHAKRMQLDYMNESLL